MTRQSSNSLEPLDLDSTQTVRALTMPELNAASGPKWHVVQLTVSNRPVNLDTMPQLDAFKTHRLYVVAGVENNVPRYALRLGFFPDEVSANMTCGYLRTFFPSASITRVSAAEQARFAPPVAQQAPPHKPASSGTDQARSGATSMNERTNGAHAPQARVAPSPASAPAVPSRPVTQKTVTAQKTAQPTKPMGTQKLQKRSMTLGEQLREEARQVQFSRTQKIRVPQQSTSWLSRLFGRDKG